MKTVSFNELKMLNKKERTAVTIGNFDGVHLGHRRLVNIIQKVSTEKSLKSTIVTFSPHPRQLFSQHGDFSLITQDAEKACIFNSLEVDFTCCLNFDERLFSLTPDEFVSCVLVNGLNCGFAAVGENFTFGKGKSGDSSAFRDLCEQARIAAGIVPSVTVDGQTVSSERIRKTLARGDVALANKLLGEPYFVMGNAVCGESRSVSIFAGKNKLLPKEGEYAVDISADTGTVRGVADVYRGKIEFSAAELGNIDGKSVIIKFLQ